MYNGVYGDVIHNITYNVSILTVIQYRITTLFTQCASFPNPLTDLYNPSALHMEYQDLLSECEAVFSTLQASRQTWCKQLLYLYILDYF